MFDEAPLDFSPDYTPDARNIREYAADPIPGGAKGAYFDQHPAGQAAGQAWEAAAGHQPRKGEEQDYCERFRHCWMYGF